jgi:PII-like signaling protein
MRLEGPARKLCAYIGENGTYEGKPLHAALVESARVAGCAGATVLRGIEGFGATSREHGKWAIRMSVDRPVVVEVIDTSARIAALAEVFSAMVGDGLITVEDVAVVAYRGGTAEAAGEGRATSEK